MSLLLTAFASVSQNPMRRCTIFNLCVTDQLTDQQTHQWTVWWNDQLMDWWTDQRTEKASYRVASPRQKRRSNSQFLKKCNRWSVGPSLHPSRTFLNYHVFCLFHGVKFTLWCIAHCIRYIHMSTSVLKYSFRLKDLIPGMITVYQMHWLYSGEQKF